LFVIGALRPNDKQEASTEELCDEGESGLDQAA